MRRTLYGGPVGQRVAEGDTKLDKVGTLPRDNGQYAPREVERGVSHCDVWDERSLSGLLEAAKRACDPAHGNCGLGIVDCGLVGRPSSIVGRCPSVVRR